MRRVIIPPLPDRLVAIASSYQGMAAAWDELLAAYSDEQLRLFLDLQSAAHPTVSVALCGVLSAELPT